jgi:hypothetical protein
MSCKGANLATPRVPKSTRITSSFQTLVFPSEFCAFACQLVMLFVATQTTRLRGEKSRRDHGANGTRVEHHLPPMATTPLQAVWN